MSIKSNITVKSNIYVNKTNSQFDEGFIRQIRDYSTLQKINSNLGRFRNNLISDVQHDIIKNGLPYCSLDKSGDKSWGTVIENGVPVFVCKCENKECKYYVNCSKYDCFREIKRKQKSVSVEENHYTSPNFDMLHYLAPDNKIIFLEDLKVRKSLEEKHSHPLVKIEPIEKKTDDVVKKTKVKKDKVKKIDAVPLSIKYTKIDNPKEIIESKIEDRIIVNAGPGTGKTYSVIKRLEYIFNNELANLANVLVLCYSRSAVNVIKKRIKSEINDGNLPIEATQLFGGIRTFDSFATYLLADDEIKETLNNLNYDERIEKFITELEKDDTVFNGLDYLIIDEMQDLVGVRARMVQAILKQIDCGFLLLGDMCQSIYDYQIQDENELNSFKFYKWLNSEFRTDVKRFELTRNMRQKGEMAIYTKNIREAILSENIERQVGTLNLCINTLKNKFYIGNIRNTETINKNGSTAILCRNNAQVSIVSSEFFEKGIEHRVMKGSQHIDLVPWIAEILSTYTEKRIGFTSFKERVYSSGYDDADIKWLLLKAVAPDDNEKVLNIELLVKNLVIGKDLPPELVLANKDLITISTIHRAKGREYDDVMLFSSDFYKNENILDEIKVAYVGLTRGKEQVSLFDIPSYYTKQLDSKRWIAMGWSRKSKKNYCKNFDIGIEGDIDPYSFVNKDIEDSISRQNYISELKPGDLLDVWRLGSKYRIYHNGFYIGMLADKIIYELRDAMNKTNHSPNLPERLENIYVNNIVTIANTKFNDVIDEPYNKSGLWLGVEITGFSKTIWY